MSAIWSIKEADKVFPKITDQAQIIFIGAN